MPQWLLASGRDHPHPEVLVGASVERPGLDAHLFSDQVCVAQGRDQYFLFRPIRADRRSPDQPHAGFAVCVSEEVWDDVAVPHAVNHGFDPGTYFRRASSMSSERQPMASNLWTKSLGWVRERVDLDRLIGDALHVAIPKGVQTYFLGGMTLFFLGVQVITGTLLTLYYRPGPESAYQSILYIMNEVRFGWLIRSIHAWGANLMIITCILHMLRVYFQGAYQKPREMTWMLGVFLLLVTMGFGFTGYLLPWDQIAFWATTVGTEIAGAVPGIGDLALRFLRNGPDVTGLTLTRFYGIHTLVLPLSVGALVLAHLLLIHEQGLAAPARQEESER